MNAAKYLFALWAGIVTYALLSVFFGATGLSAQRQLENEHNKQEANIENLKSIHGNLERTMNSLLYDKDTLSVYAREQGYASGQERFIRIVGLGTSLEVSSDAGETVTAVMPRHTPDRAFRIIGLCAGLTIFVCIALSDFLGRLDGKKRHSNGHRAWN